MKKICIILIILLSSWASCVPAQEEFLRYGIYYGTASEKGIRNVDWSHFDLMILNPGDPGNDYRNLKDPAFLILMQEMRNEGVQIFLRQDIGCESDLGGLYYSRTDRETWLQFKKREISIFMRYADGIYLDCIGPRQGGRVYSAQFLKDVQELVDHVHYSRGQVIIGNLWGLMDWVKSGDLDLIPYEADYVLFEGAWSMTVNQYSDDFNPLNALLFARSYDLEVLGLDYGREQDRDRLMYCYCASRIFGLSGFYYSSGNFYDGVAIPEVPYDLGLPLGPYSTEGVWYTREFQRGKLYVDFQTHRGWIEGEAEEASNSVFLVIAGFFLIFYFKRRNS